MRVADYIAQTIKKYSNTIYMVTGGGAMHLNDAFGKSGIDIIFCHHEQACAIAAEAHARISNNTQFINVTTGPGGINALNGVFGAWTDSIPMLVVSGQVKRETLVGTYGEAGGWRQLGDQEADVISMAKGITKYAICIDKTEDIRYHLEKAIYLAQTGRPGPCWIDVPIDIQAAQINPEELRRFIPEQKTEELSESLITAILDQIKKSKRPVFYIGSGVHISNTKNDVIKLADTLGIPIVTAWNSNDLIPDNHPLYVGRPGTIGNRSGNFVVQSADLIIVLGSRLNIRLVSYNWKSFAPKAFKIGIDVDEKELNKPTCNFDMKIVMDLKNFVPAMVNAVSKRNDIAASSFAEWVCWGKERAEKYPVCLPEYWTKTKM